MSRDLIGGLGIEQWVDVLIRPDIFFDYFADLPNLVIFYVSVHQPMFGSFPTPSFLDDIKKICGIKTRVWPQFNIA